MIIAFLVVLLVAVYGTGIGLTYGYAISHAKARCINCTRSSYCSDDHEIGAFILAVAFPLGLPAVLAMNMTNGIRPRVSKAERRREQELSEIEHRLEIARKELQEEELINRRLYVSSR